MATSSSVDAESRRAGILAILGRSGSIKIDATASELRVSPMTVRRDLDELERDGLLRRVRGGAVAAAGPRSFDERRAVRARAKQQIAAKAIALIPDGEAIAFDASSTTGTIAAALPVRERLTVVTNSFDNFSTLRSARGAEPILIGGEQEPTTGSFVGMIACEGAASLLYRRFFTSATAVDALHGSSEVSLAESQVKRAFAQRSQEVVLCIDSSKLDKRSMARGFPFEEVAVMVTELEPSDPRLDPYRARVELL